LSGPTADGKECAQEKDRKTYHFLSLRSTVEQNTRLSHPSTLTANYGCSELQIPDLEDNFPAMPCHMDRNVA
jgi:hypothetical protein